MPHPFVIASTTHHHPSSFPHPPFLPSDLPNCSRTSNVAYHRLSHTFSPFHVAIPIYYTPSYISWDLLYYSLQFLLSRGFTMFQDLEGSVLDTDWDSPVPQAASIEGQGEGTCAALVGFHLVPGLILS